MADDEPTTHLKRCSRCKMWLPRDSAFHRNRSRTDGLAHCCRECDAEARNAKRLAYYYANRDKMRADSQRWARAHPEKMRGYTAKWQRNNPDKIADYANSDRGREVRRRASAKFQASEHGKAAAFARRQLDEVKKAAREATARWRERNPERAREKDRAHKKTERGRLTGRIVSIRRRARKAEIPGDHTPEDIHKLLERSNRCHLCGKPFTKRRPPTVDHVLPISSELGTNDPSNLALAHKSCNSKKQALRMNPISGQGILI